MMQVLIYAERSKKKLKIESLNYTDSFIFHVNIDDFT